MKKPIIFLNIDGVLISEDYILNNSSDISKLYTRIDNRYYMNFDNTKIDLLKQIINETDAYIVITSYWCEYSDLNKIRQLFSKYQLEQRVVDMIPFIPKKSGYRVRNWIDKNSSNFNNLNNKNFVIIDNDDTGIFEDYHVKCNAKIGLTNEDANKSIKKLIKG